MRRAIVTAASFNLGARAEFGKGFVCVVWVCAAVSPCAVTHSSDNWRIEAVEEIVDMHFAGFAASPRIFQPND
jgi:hypothetical protein